VKVALTGANGMLGHDLAKAFRGNNVIALTHEDLDVTDLDKTLALIRDTKPDYVIHGAAYTDVDGCEGDSKRAYLVNGIGTRNVAIACEENACPIIYISSDYVFDGMKKEPCNEWDHTNPINKYGLSKLLGENYVSSLTNRFYIVRTSWLFGKKGKNFVEKILKLLEERDEIEVVDDQLGSPTYTLDFATKIKELTGRGYGIYHITNSGHCSWYQFAVEIARLKRSRTKVRPVTSDKLNRPARRPSFSVLENTMLELEGIEKPRHWKDALEDYLSEVAG
jgi:dTDP-4-dehydrorhamnose reductase